MSDNSTIVKVESFLVGVSGEVTEENVIQSVRQQISNGDFEPEFEVYDD